MFGCVCLVGIGFLGVCLGLRSVLISGRLACLVLFCLWVML